MRANGEPGLRSRSANNTGRRPLRAARESGCDFECREKPERMMAENKDDNELAMLEKDISDFWAKFKASCCVKPIDQVLGLKDSWYESINSLSDKWFKRLKEGEEIINKFHEYTQEVCELNKSIEKKQAKISEALSNIKDEEKEKTDFVNSIQELKKELIRTNHKTTTEMEERFHMAGKLLKERLGLEIRKTCDKHLQFVFRCIDHKDFQKPYILTLSINEEGDYEVVSCSPPLDCIEELQQKVRETNNFSAFMANIRKAFIALTYQ